MTNFLLLITMCLGCWSELPLDQHVQARPLIIQATLTVINRAPEPSIRESVVAWWTGNSPRRYDRATLKIDAVLKNSDPSVVPLSTIVLIMPSPDNETRLSTDFNFPIGTTGIWMLMPNNDSWVAWRPDDLQPLAQAETIRRYIAEQSATPTK